MAGQIRVNMNEREVGEYLDGKHGVEQMLDKRIERVLSDARGRAPVASGTYRRSLHIETVRHDRIVKRVVSNVDYAGVVEAREGVLSRSLDAAGGA